MTKVVLCNGVKWSIDKRFKQKLDIALDDVKHSEMDLVIPITGKEGAGKSFAARSIAMYCATFLGSSFDVDDVVFELDAYIKNSDKKGLFAINVLDEARNVLGRSKTRSKDVIRFLDYISECRDKQQIHIICLPAFHDLASYIVLWRTSFIMEFKKNHVKNDKRLSGFELKRGEFRVYTDKNDLEKYYDIRFKYPKHYFVRNWWSNKEVFSLEQLNLYKENKAAARKRKYVIEEKKPKTAKDYELEMRAKFVGKMKEAGLTNVRIAELLGVSEKSIRRSARELYNNSTTGVENTIEVV